MDINNNKFLSIDQVTDKYLSGSKIKNQSEVNSTGQSFADVFRQKISASNKELTFSKHAINRLEQRNIDLSDEQLTKLSEALDKAESKGIKDSLVMMDNMAFIMNVPSKTVITALTGDEAASNVFTNINGAVII